MWLMWRLWRPLPRLRLPADVQRGRSAGSCCCPSPHPASLLFAPPPPPPSSLLPSLTLLPSQQFDRPLFFPSSVSPSGFSFVPLMSPSSTGCCGQSSRSDTPHPSVLYSLPPSTPHFLFSAVILKFLSLQIQMIFVFVCLVHHFKNKRFSVYLIIFYYLTDLNNFLFFGKGH